MPGSQSVTRHAVPPASPLLQALYRQLEAERARARAEARENRNCEGSSALWRCSCLVQGWLLEALARLQSGTPRAEGTSAEALATPLLASITLAMLEDWRESWREPSLEGRREPAAGTAADTSATGIGGAP